MEGQVLSDRNKRLALSAVLLMAGMAIGPIAMAGPFADFERAMATAYAPYRAALAQTNLKDKAATEKSLQAFEERWAGLMAAHRNAPPPQYADDPKWRETVAAIDRIIAEAKVATAKGQLAEAHEILEAVRVQLGDLRARNGVVVFSDRMDAYHEKMEETLAAGYGGFNDDGLNLVRENAAVLAYLGDQLQRHTPPALKADPAFQEGLAGLLGSVKALRAAARAGDKAAIGAALKGLKPPYAKVFVRFG